MLLEKKREHELEQRKGLARRAILQLSWFILTGVIAYYLIQALIEAGTLSYDMIYSQLALPRTIPEEALLGGMILAIVVVMQFFFMLGYFLVSPLGRTRPGQPSLRGSAHDPLENEYRR